MQHDTHEYFGQLSTSDVDQSHPDLNEEKRKAEHIEWVWDNLSEKQRRIILRKAATRVGIRLNDTVDYALLSWNDFPETEHTVGLKDQLTTLIDEARP